MTNWQIKSLILLIIDCYQKFVSPFFPNSCRFYPSCSQYVKQAIMKYGVIKGIFWGIKRILKCHPLSKGGFDPI